MKDGRVVSAVQAELNDDMEDMMKRACWVDITKDMEISEQVEYEHVARGQAHLLNLSNPEALNFSDEQSMKSLNTQATDSMTYTTAFLTSLGDMAYMPGNKDIDSQESDIFDVNNDSSNDDTIDMIVDGGIITNLQYVSGPASAREETREKDADEGQEKEVDAKADNNNSHKKVMVMSLAKVTRKATTSSGIPQEASQGQQDLVQGLIQQWVNMQGSEVLPPELASLAVRLWIEVTTNVTPSPHQAGRRSQYDKTCPLRRHQ
jgi:hypothetical protein